MPETVPLDSVNDIEEGSLLVEEGPDFDSGADEDEPNWEAKATELEAELETERKRRADTQRDWQEQQKAIGYYESMLDQVSSELDDRQGRYEQEPPPMVEDPDELLTDGKKLMEYMGERDRYMYNAVTAQYEPLLSQATAQGSLLKRIIRNQQKDAYEEAEKRLQGEPGYKAGDLRKIWPGVDTALRQSPKHDELRMDPEALITAYTVVKRAERRGQPRPVRHRAADPTGVEPGAPLARGGDPGPIPRQFVVAAKKLGRDPKKLWKRHRESGGR